MTLACLGKQAASTPPSSRQASCVLLTSGPWPYGKERGSLMSRLRPRLCQRRQPESPLCIGSQRRPEEKKEGGPGLNGRWGGDRQTRQAMNGLVNRCVREQRCLVRGREHIDCAWYLRYVMPGHGTHISSVQGQEATLGDADHEWMPCDDSGVMTCSCSTCVVWRTGPEVLRRASAEELGVHLYVGESRKRAGHFARPG